LDGFLQANHINAFSSHVVLKLGALATPAKAPNIPTHNPHWLSKMEARAWRASVLCRFNLGPNTWATTFLFFPFLSYFC
jgi:hypothetical protein